MGNSCSTKPETLEIQQEQQQKKEKFFTPLKGNFNQEGFQQEQSQLPQNQSIQHQKMAQIAKDRVANYSPKILKSLGYLNQVKILINPIIAPSDAVIQLKDHINSYFMYLYSIQIYWIGIYDINQSDYLQTIVDLNGLLDNLLKYLYKLLGQNQDTNQNQNLQQSIDYQLLSNNLHKLDEQKYIYSNFNNFFEQNLEKFAHFNSLKCNNDIQLANYYKIKVKGITNDINSSQPGYLRAAFKNEVGFKIWEQIVGGSFDVSKGYLIRNYQQKFEINIKVLQQVVHSTLNYCNTISLIDFLNFIKKYPSLFDNEGKLIEENQAKVEELLGSEITVQEYFENQSQPNSNKYSHGEEGKYTGKILNGVFEGQGELSLKKHFYEAKGEFKKGFLNGPGKVVKQGVEYTGNFVRGLLQGKGEVKFPDGTVYQGEFQDNVYNGEGILTHYNAVQVRGQFVDGFCKHGDILLPTGEQYTGPILHNRKRTGNGIEVVKNTQLVVFEGQYQDDEYLVGKLYAPDGSKLWFDGELNFHQVTKGIYHYHGGQYIGDFFIKNYQRQGKGILNYGQNIQNIDGKWSKDVPVEAVHYFDAKNPSSKYVGPWQNFYYHGYAEIFYQSGDHFKGYFEKGVQCGQGVYTYKNGDKYEGPFKNNKFEGKGVYKFNNGDEYKGEFKNNQFNGYGVYIFDKSKEKYEGQWLNDMFHGIGTLYNYEGCIKQQGQWDQNKFTANQNQQPQQQQQQQQPQLQQSYHEQVQKQIDQLQNQQNTHKGKNGVQQTEQKISDQK